MSDIVPNAPRHKAPKDSSEISYVWNIDLLGRLAAHRRAQPTDSLKRFQTSKTGAVLAFLAFHLGTDTSKEFLIDQIWPDADLNAGRHNLNQSLCSLRKQLEPPGTTQGTVIQCTHQYARLNTDAVTTDVQSFSRLVREAEASKSVGDRIALLRNAMDFYGGDLLPGYLDEWTLIERERLNGFYITCVKSLSDALEAEGRLDQAVGVLFQGARLATTDEEIWRRLIRLLGETGKPEAAVEHYKRFAKQLRNFEDRAPSAETRNLVAALRPGRSITRSTRTARSLRKTRPSEAADAVETAGGSAVGAEDRHSTPPPGAILPARLTKFFGRQAELNRILAKLSLADETGRALEANGTQGPVNLQANTTSRLVSIIGPGGSGKTRLALEAVSLHAERSAGKVLFVPLADVADSDSIAPAILHALNLREVGQIGQMEQVIAALTGNNYLLALDNLEHLLPSARPVIETLLSRLPLLTCLVTSQQAVLADGEQEMPLAPFVVPDVTSVPVDALQWDVVQLFADRAQLVRPDFQITPRNAAAVCQICRQLDGIPLAIELAASRVQALSATEVLEELTNRFGFLANRRKSDRRHRTLEDALSWSFDLLSAESKKAFLQLSVFCAGWTLEAAKRICQDTDIHLVLEDLTSRSMISVVETGERSRYRMLETMRRFASEQTSRSYTPRALNSLSGNHAAYYCDLAVSRESLLRGKSSLDTIAELRMESENLNASLSWLLDHENLRVSAVEMSGALWRYWYWSGTLKEGRTWLERALQVVDAGFAEQSLKLLIGAGAVTRLLGDMETAREYLERGILKCKQLGVDQRSSLELKLAMGDLYLHLGILDDELGEYELAMSHYKEAALIRRGLSDRWGEAALLSNRGRAEQKLSMFDKALEHYRKAAELYNEEGDLLQSAAVWNNIGAACTRSGDLLSARAALQTSRDIFIAQGNRWAAAMPSLNLGEVLQKMGLFELAKKELKDCLTIRRELGDKPGIPYCLQNLGSVAVSMKEYLPGVHLLSSAEAMFKQLGTPMVGYGLEEMLHDLAVAKAHMTFDDFETARSYGFVLTGERAINYALNY